MSQSATRPVLIQQTVVTAEQMRQIEARVFAAGMPVAALMEKVGGLISRRVQALVPIATRPRIGVLVGPGHNGADGLVVARELHFSGYEVRLYCPFSQQKELTGQHWRYCQSLGLTIVTDGAALQECDWLLDGLFGFGLERSLQGEIASTIDTINTWAIPVISIDLPSGLHTDTGEILGTAIQATHTLCLGLWKLGLLQDHALAKVGTAELIDFDIPIADVEAVVGNPPPVRRVTPQSAIAHLPLPRPASTHKYKMGHLLLVCGSRRYAGAALLCGLGARASGVGMLSIAVPASLKPLLTAQLPEALILECPETETGAIAALPEGTNLDSFNTIACGPGLTGEATPIVQHLLESDRLLVLDADGLNILSQLGAVSTLGQRSGATVLTPHVGEFKRLFPGVEPLPCRVAATRQAANQSGAIVLLKGARVAISDPLGLVWINPISTPALARGGSGDVLTGLLGGLLAQINVQSQSYAVADIVQSAVWWHAQAGILGMHDRTELGVDAFTLTQFLIPALKQYTPALFQNPIHPFED